MASSAQRMSASASLPGQVLRMSTCFCTLRQMSFTIWSAERLHHALMPEQHCQFPSLPRLSQRRMCWSCPMGQVGEQAGYNSQSIPA